MGKVKVVNNSLQILNLLVKENRMNKTIQLLSKENCVIDATQVTEQINRLRDLNVVSVLPYTETIIV